MAGGGPGRHSDFWLKRLDGWKSGTDDALSLGRVEFVVLYGTFRRNAQRHLDGKVWHAEKMSDIKLTDRVQGIISCVENT